MKPGDKIRQQVLEACDGCGICKEQCDHLAAQGDNTPGSIAEALMGDNPGPDITDFILKCSLCGLCKELCPQDLDVSRMVSETRDDFMEAGVSDPEQYRFLWVDHDWNAFSLYRRAYGLDKVYEPLLKETCDVLFFPAAWWPMRAPSWCGRLPTGLGKVEKESALLFFVVGRLWFKWDFVSGQQITQSGFGTTFTPPVRAEL